MFRHFCNRSVNDILLLEELRAMEKASMGRLSISFYVDEVTPIGPRKRKGRTKTGLVQGPASEGVYEGVLTQNVVERIISSIDPTAMVVGERVS